MIITRNGTSITQEYGPYLMSPRASDRALDLPPLFTPIALRELGDAFAHGCQIAGERGAGTLVWVRRFDVAEFAVVLEPEEPLREARRAFLVGMNAVADALTAFAPPTMAISFDWPDAVRVDGVLVGGGRLGWPDCAEDEVPAWLVFSATIRTAVIRAGDAGMRPLLGGLDEIGFEEIDAGEIVARFSRHLMAGFHDWAEQGFAAVEERYLSRLPPATAPHSPSPHPLGLRRVGLSSDGRSDGLAKLEGLRAALLTPSWQNPETGMPWL
jgi:hypothetical protein